MLVSANSYALTSKINLPLYYVVYHLILLYSDAVDGLKEALRFNIRWKGISVLLVVWFSFLLLQILKVLSLFACSPLIVTDSFALFWTMLS